MVTIKAEKYNDLLPRLISRGEDRESLMFSGISAPDLSEITCHSSHSKHVGGTVMPLTLNLILLLMKLETFFVPLTVHVSVFLRNLLFTSH